MREKASFKVTVVVVAILIVITTALAVPTPADLGFQGKMMLGILLASILLWVTEAIPILATAWLFAAAVPLLGIMDSGETWAAGVSVAMVICISCFAFALFIQKSTISLRIVALVLGWSKNNSKKALLGLMIATALLSTIIDDLILVLMMLPFVYKILDTNKTPWGGSSQLAKCLILGVCFSSYIGGWVTPVGSVVNVLAMGFAESALGVSVTFANWMIMGVIICIPVLAVAYITLSLVFKPEEISDEALAAIKAERDALPGLTKDEIWGILVMVVTVILWVASSWITSINLVVVGLIAFGLFFLPPFKVINFQEYATESAWQVVMLNWGVGCFVAGITTTGAMTWLVANVFGGLAGLPIVIVMILCGIFACVFHNILPAGAAVAGLLTIPVCTLVANMGGNITAAIFLCAVFSCAAFLLPLDLCVYCAYGTERKYFSITDELKAGWAPSIAAIFMCAVVIPAVCTAMGLA